MKTFILERSGSTPVEFDGELISAAGFSEHHRFDYARNKPIGIIQRGHRLEIYRTASGKLILHIWFMSAWPNEPDYFETKAFGSIAEIADELKAYGQDRIIRQFVGPPAGSMNARLNRDSIIKGFKLQFDGAVTDLLSELQPERID